tara:strand:- start:43 stop:264 length:222 start_codon:yes stop_codon:yes gene_type:complete
MTELTVYNLENIEVSESLCKGGRCITVSIKSGGHNEHSTTTDIELFTNNRDKSFHDYIPEEWDCASYLDMKYR